MMSTFTLLGIEPNHMMSTFTLFGLVLLVTAMTLNYSNNILKLQIQLRRAYL
jgi:hypothetical protein